MKLRWGLMLLLAACSSHHGSQPSTGAGPGPSGGGKFGNSSGNGSGTGNDGSVVRADGVGEPCNEEGATRACCETGRQTCGGTAEFQQWGPCLGPDGKQVTCMSGGPDDCESSEFSQICDAGPPPPPTSCKDDEFAAGCDGGAPPPPTSCKDDEFAAGCDGGAPPPPTSCDEDEFAGCKGEGDGGLPPTPGLCTKGPVNNEPEILVGYSPAMGETVSESGQIKVWVNDERPEIIAANEKIDMKTGKITAPGDRTGTADDGYLWEPALYIAPMTAENGGTPHFPQYIKGWYNNMLSAAGTRFGGPASGVQVPGMDPVPPGMPLVEMYSTELIWDVDWLGLGPGTYVGEFVIHDGDHDRAVGCVTITITP